MDTRDALFLGLNDLGVRARLPSNGSRASDIGKGRRLGVIEIDLAPLQWLAVREVGEGGATNSEIDLCIPDMRLAKMPEVGLVSIHSDASAATGEPHWKGNDLGLGILDALNGYPALNRSLGLLGKPLPPFLGNSNRQPSVRLSAVPRERCWAITLPVRLEVNAASLFAGHKTRVPTAEELACYREIGRLLLNSPLSKQGGVADLPNRVELLERQAFHTLDAPDNRHLSRVAEHMVDHYKLDER